MKLQIGKQEPVVGCGEEALQFEYLICKSESE